jgi:heme/copper-type cytochrome/quinol oxidase subunit 2
MHFMNEKTTTPSLLRLAAAIFLGLIVGFILFLVAALFIGMFNQLMGMQIPIGMDVAENILSAILLVIFVGGSVGLFCWKVWTTPATEEAEESPQSEE